MGKRKKVLTAKRTTKRSRVDATDSDKEADRLSEPEEGD